MVNRDLPDHLNEGDVEVFSLKRIKQGTRFLYKGEAGEEIKGALRSQLEDYGIPNTWTEVKLSPSNHTHILATGYDGSGKLQYLYHPDYLEYRNALKFMELTDFGLALPRIRRKVNAHLKHDDWDEQKLLALITKILDKHYLRIGTRAYAKSNNSFGLTTLRRKHLNETEHGLSFEYKGKSHQQRRVELHNEQLVEYIKECADFPGWEIFSFKKASETVKASSTMVNEYIREMGGADFSAKTFRTWGGTSLSVKLQPKAKRIVEKNKRKELGATLVQLVAERLGNTPSICRQYYIHPMVLETVLEPGFQADPKPNGSYALAYLNKFEQRTLEILNQPKTQ
jgi:DNA topoisomerase-1